MCGICGFIGWENDAALDMMMQRLIHRGPDDSGIHREPGLALGARRLQVIDPDGGHQPIGNESGTVWAALNGEIYNYRELKKELQEHGHRFSSNCDTEVLVHLYEQYGEEFVHRLRGMYAFALWDRHCQTLLLVRDRLGIKPLYYAVEKEQVVFASELPALVSGLSSCSVRSEAIAQYLQLLYVPGPETIFEGLRHLRPGEMLKADNGKVETRQYWTPQAVARQQNDCLQGNDEESFLALLQESVHAHLVSDVPVGLFLSGGLDSASILAMMRAGTNGLIRTFSIGYDSKADHSFNELDAARSLANHFGAEHTEEKLTPDVVKVLPHIVSAMGEPFADSSAIPTYLVSEVARRSVTVALSGIGGDELWGGYPRYLGVRASTHYEHIPVAVRRWLATHVASRLPETGGVRDHVGRMKRFLHSGSLSIEEQYLQWITCTPAEWGGSAFTSQFLEQVNVGATHRLYQQMFTAWPSADPTDCAMGLDLQTYLPDDLLRMGDRMSMSHSLELRVPFCDPRLLAMALRMPSSTRFSGWTLKAFMRKSLTKVLPSHIMDRPKCGFMLPLARWLREDLKEMACDLLCESRLRRRGYVKPEYVQWLLCEHQTGSRNFADQIYALLILELWHTMIEEATSFLP
ncbi:MAG: asparagine synthetase B [Nitrospirales bacterium]|nr:MAG: asparagine synthetase B [Nitrospirales bacterium]